MASRCHHKCPLFFCNIGVATKPRLALHMAVETLLGHRHGGYLQLQAEVRKSSLVLVSYVSEKPEPDGPCDVLWQLRHVFQPFWDTSVARTKCCHRWFKRHKSNIESLLISMGIAASAIRPSVVEARARGLDEASITSCHASATGNTAAILLALLLFSETLRMKAHQAAALAVLHDLLVFGFGNTLPAGPLQFSELGPPCVEEDPLCSMGAPGDRHCEHTRSIELPEGPAGLAKFLAELYGLRPQCHRIREWFIVVLEALSAHMAHRCRAQQFGTASQRTCPFCEARSVLDDLI